MTYPCKIVILLLIIVIIPVRLLANKIEILADVNGEPISNLDVEKRISLINSLFYLQNNETLKFQTLKQLIDEIIIVNEAQNLNIKLSDKDLNDAIISFMTKNFKIKNNEVSKYIEKQNIDLNALKRHIKCQLLWIKIIETKVIPFIKISDEEICNVKKQMEELNWLVTFEEFIPNSNQENWDIYETAKNFAERLLNNDNNFILEPAIKIHKLTVNLSQLKRNLKNVLENAKIGDIIGPIKLNKNYYSVIRITDKVQLSYSFLKSTLKVKQVIIKNYKNLLNEFKKQKVDCLNFDKIVNNFKLKNIKEFEMKIQNLNPSLQISFKNAKINDLIELKKDDTIRLMLLCDIKNTSNIIEDIKQQIYQQKVLIQSNSLLDNIRKSTAISYFN
ncbi:MAG: SurA N-terminal domain-containing protein [Wolbachia endosymbiont of Menacanthus eurysternus]|nr:MAG: SurA N-terminal domain-containing protein [Wolbachia endosymbiont of Menacanthus eurysternus]